MKDSGAEAPKSKLALSMACQAALLAGIAATSLYGYLLFHTIAELYSIVIALTFFILAWQTRNLSEHPQITALGLCYLFVGILDLFHTLSYQGLDIFRGYDFPANQVWVVARLLESLGLLGFTFLSIRTGPRLGLLMVLLAAYSAAGLLAIFVLRIFPACFVAGQGQTNFKVAMEILIMSLLAAAAATLARRRALFQREIYLSLVLSIVLTMLSELPFALYRNNYDWMNLTGHLLKIASFYIIYRSILVVGLQRPQELLFQRLQAREAELARANESQNAVLALMAHDLRSPLGSVASLAQDLAMAPEDMAREDRQEITGALASASAKALDLVEGILAWAKSMRDDFEPRIMPLILEEALQDQARLLEGTIKAKGLSLRLSIPPEAKVLADREMLAAAIRNILHNAVKFSPSGSSIEVGAESSQGGWVLGIRDHGQGMAPERLARLFRYAGEAGSPGTAGERGSGIGLDLTKRFVDRMGGRLEVESEPGKGARFSLWLREAG